MADITMCNGLVAADGYSGECPFKSRCYRHTATANEYRQSYFMGAPFKQGHCPHFWDVKGNYPKNPSKGTPLEKYNFKMAEMSEDRDLRVGQKVFNAAFEADGEYVTNLASSPIDPFYDDSLVMDFLKNVFEEWNKR